MVNLIYIGGAILVFIVGIVLYFYFRDSPKNNFKRAQKHHMLGEKYYLMHELEESKFHYDAANKYREKALRQMGEL